jgi:hypothetical protein
MLVSALASVAAAAFAPPAFAPTEASSTRIASSGQPLLSHLSRTLTPLHRERCLSRCVRMDVIEREVTEAEREAKRVAALARLARIRLLNNIALVNAVVIGFVAFSVGYEILCHQAALERAPRLLSTTGVRVPLVTEGRISGPSPRSTILTLGPISTGLRTSGDRGRSARTTADGSYPQLRGTCAAQPDLLQGVHVGRRVRAGRLHLAGLPRA